MAKRKKGVYKAKGDKIEDCKYRAEFDRAFETLMDSDADETTLQAALIAYETTKVQLSNRMVNAAGYAKYLKGFGGVSAKELQISLSIPIFARISDEEKFQVVSHEFAHIVDAILRGHTNHDYKWKSLHKKMGGDGLTYHNYDLSGLGKKMQCRIIACKKTGKEFVITPRRWSQLRLFSDKYVLLAHGVTQNGTVIERTPVVSFAASKKVKL